MAFLNWLGHQFTCTVIKPKYPTPQFVNWRLYWVFTPGALIAGITCDPYIILGSTLFILLLRVLYLHSYIECTILLPWLFLGLLLGLYPRATHVVVSGVVSLTSDTHIYLSCDDGTYKKIGAKEFVLPGTWVKISTNGWDVPVLPGSAGRTNILRVKDYLEIREGQAGHRQAISDNAYTHLSQDSASVANALTIGVNRISDELREHFAKSGLSHLLAISGLHIGIVCGGALLFFHRLLMFILGFGDKLAVCLSLLVGLCYGTLAGFGLSLMRSWCMFAISSIAWSYGRLTDPIRICGATACGLLCLYPEQWCTPSFVLSFAATASLLSGNTLTTYIITAPYALYFFFQMPLQPFVANSLAIPLLTFIIMPVLLTHTFLGTLGLDLLSTPVDYAIQCLIAIAKAPLSYTMHVGMQNSVGIFVWTLCVFAFFALRSYIPLLPGAACVLCTLYFGGVHEPLAMKYAGMFGLWDGKEILWVSDEHSWVAQRWSAALCAKQIQRIEHDGILWVAQYHGYLWLPDDVWFGRYTTSRAKGQVFPTAHLRLWSKPPKHICATTGVYDFSDDAAWIWLRSGKIWRANNRLENMKR